ncbi:hypothetical protein V8C42DRAFT_325261, partial [Trichoderma barbatum]
MSTDAQLLHRSLRIVCWYTPYSAAGMAETQLRCRIAVVDIWRCHKAAAFGRVETQKLLQALTCASFVHALLVLDI